MTMDDFDALLLHHPGITGLTYGSPSFVSGTSTCLPSPGKSRHPISAMSDEVARCGHCSYPEVGRGGAQGLGAGRPISLIESLMKLAIAWVAHRRKAALRAHRRETDPPEPTLPSGRLEEMQGVRCSVRGRQSGQRAAQNERYASSNPHIDAWWASATQTAPEDAYKRLIDACRLAVEEAYTSHGVAIGSYSEASGVGGAGMRFFDNFLRTASRQGLWPPWWTFADVAAVKRLTRRRASASCTRKRCRT